MRSLLGLFVASALLTFASIASAQTAHQHHHTEQSSLFAPRESSGTAWQPDETIAYGIHRTWGDWNVTFHGNLFGQFIYEPGEIHRTGGFSTHQFESSNWGMAMMRRRVGAAIFGLRATLSLEPWTLPGCGSLDLLATGEICEGDTIHDRQHPHDLFMELAADYDKPLNASVHWQLYAGLAGEPALGPPGFPHRLSAIDNPVAPIGHHWLDSTHITFGVITTGVYNKQWKVEVSIFNAREPDDRRTDLELGALDSVSGRVSYSPSSRLTFQVSAGHLNDAEFEFGDVPRIDVNRLTSSAMYQRALGASGFWATTIALGINSGTEIIPGGSFEATTAAGLLETSLTFNDRDVWFGRAEIVDKPAHDLHAHEFATSIFTVGKLQAGYMRKLKSWRGIAAGVGGTITAALVPDALASRYNGHVAPGFGVFFNLRPSRHTM